MDNQQSFWYIIHVRAGKETRVMDDLRQAYDKRGLAYRFEPFCPESEFYYRNKKAKLFGKEYRKRLLFSGYVFVETDMPQELFLKEFSAFVRESEDMIRILRYGNTQIAALPRDEQIRFEYLFMGKRCIERSEGYISGDKIIVTAGPLVGREGMITRVNRHNRTATVELVMFGGKIEADLALEIVDKI